jgi:hypothetical protein
MYQNVGLAPNDVPEGLWQVVGQDLITGLPNVKGFNVIATFVDHYEKQVHIVPTTDKVDLDGIAEIHHCDIFQLYGIPRKFILNQGPQFASCVMRALLKRLRVKAGITTAYHLQANGQIKRINCKVATYLCMFYNCRKTDWVGQLPMAEFALNNRVNNAISFSLFYLTYRYQLDFTIPPDCTNAPAADWRFESLWEAREKAELSLCIAKERMAQAHQPHVPSTPFKVGSHIWLNIQHLKIKSKLQKLNPKCVGPFKVFDRVSELDYGLELPPTMNLHDIFHADRLTRATINEMYGKLSQPDSIEINGDLKFKVEKILDSKHNCQYLNGILYLIWWKGYGPGSDTWEGIKSLEHAKKAIAEFHKKHSEVPKKLSVAVFMSLPWQRIENLTEASTQYTWEDGCCGQWGHWQF